RAIAPNHARTTIGLPFVTLRHGQLRQTRSTARSPQPYGTVLAASAAMFHTARHALLILVTLLLLAPAARGADTLCDPSNANCRTQLLTLIQNERVGIDVGFWFMQDSRYMSEIIRRWQAG